VLSARAAALEGSMTQDTLQLIQDAATDLHLTLTRAQAEAVRKVMLQPAESVFDGAWQLLESMKDAGLRTVIISNAVWRTNADYLRDFTRLGLKDCVDAVVSSVDAGVRKPSPAFWQIAIAEAGCGPEHILVIGNSETNDIRPAHALGLRSIRVAIEEPMPADTEADAATSSLFEVETLVRRWCHDGTVTRS